MYTNIYIPIYTSELPIQIPVYKIDLDFSYFVFIMSGDEAVLVDPMCGSGTLLSEAALIATNVAPGLMRPSKSWPFRKWPDLDKQVWDVFYIAVLNGTSVF